jgi:hypothetical protein
MKEWLLRGPTGRRWFGTAVRAFIGLTATLAFALPTTLLLSTQASSAAPPASAYAGTVAAVEGTDNQVYIRANLPGVPSYAAVRVDRWVGLGGLDPNGPPDVVDVGGEPLYIAIGTDNALWVRTIASTTWTRFPGLNGAPSFCRNSPGAVWSRATETLFIGCQASDNTLWVANTPAVAGETSFSNVPWTSYGGALAAGPALAFPTGATRPSFVATISTGQVYYHGPSTGDSWLLSNWDCTGGHLAANSNPNGNFSAAACRGPVSPDGTFNAWFSPFPASPTFDPILDMGGNLAAVAGPGVAWTNDEIPDAVVYAQGTDNAVWTRRVGEGNTWASLGGQAKNGVEAAYICSSNSLECAA